MALKKKLVKTPVLAYHDFDCSFVLETDASAKGMGTVLSQNQGNNLLHPVAYMLFVVQRETMVFQS